MLPENYNEANIYKCGTCGRLFAIQYWLEIHNEKHRMERLQQSKELQRHVDAQWHADHPSRLMEAWNKLLDSVCRLFGV